MDTARADLVLQYVLAAAGERHGTDREVTAVQLMKYVYLADLAHAERHAGATFTLARWVFESHGPYAFELEDRIGPVVRRIGATSRGAYFLLEDDDLGHRRAAEIALPAAVSGAVMQSLRAFARDTNALLARVYATVPMRRALPDAVIDFSPVTPAEVAMAEPAAFVRCDRAPSGVALLAKDAARYDAVFDDGHRALDASEGAVRACQGALTIDPAVWGATARMERDVP